MAKYRKRDETELRWNRIRRRLTRELDTQIKDWREDALDKLLSDAWTKYSEALQTETKLELEEHYGAWVTRALDEAGVGVDVEAA